MCYKYSDWRTLCIGIKNKMKVCCVLLLMIIISAEISFGSTVGSVLVLTNKKTNTFTNDRKKNNSATKSSNHPQDTDAKRTIKDMGGRVVVIPNTITKVLTFGPPPATFVYMLAPEKLGAWLGAVPRKGAAKFIPEKYQDKTVLQWERQSTQYETYIAAHPDIVITGLEAADDTLRANQSQEKLGNIPVVCVENTRNALGYAGALKFMGDILGVPDRAEKLVSYYENVLKEVTSRVAVIPQQKRVRVYYAEGANGLSTDPAGSVHSQLIEVCGGVNVADCQINSGSGMTAVTMESVLSWKPEIIITTSKDFAEKAVSDETWKLIPAVKMHNIHLSPSEPFNWFDRPPGVNRIAGIPWVAHILYPDLFNVNWFRTKEKEFYALFYHYNLSDKELDSLLVKK